MTGVALGGARVRLVALDAAGVEMSAAHADVEVFCIHIV